MDAHGFWEMLTYLVVRCWLLVDGCSLFAGHRTQYAVRFFL
ncbi:hypothetical protein I600_207 [Maribacter dokdonensis DSW-8]|nr:hypothetical protein I600_207 [Maribacter dokdonensis DSW-8]